MAATTVKLPRGLRARLRDEIESDLRKGIGGSVTELLEAAEVIPERMTLTFEVEFRASTGGGRWVVKGDAHYTNINIRDCDSESAAVEIRRYFAEHQQAVGSSQ